MRKKILVVDDEKLIRDLLRIKLAPLDVEVETAQNAEEFIQKAPVFKPHLIILDIWLKSRLGPEAYDELLYSGYDKNVPVIFITALTEGEPKDTELREKKKYVLYSKPFDFEKLLPEIKSMLDESDRDSVVTLN